MEYEWDPEKAAANLRNHGVRFSDAALVLEDPLARTIKDPSSEAEDRSVTIGVDPLGRALVVIYTYRGDRVRIISARIAEPRERREYEASS